MNVLHPKIEMTVESNDFSVFQGLFSYGFMINVETGNSLLDVLCRQVCISERYLNDRVQTIFLNGNVVDDLTREIVEDDAVIALSAAMPGLAGAVFRKGGIFSPMRACSAQREDVPSGGHTGLVTLKFFNLIAADLGPGFLKKGILVKKDLFIRFYNWKKSNLRSVCRKLTIDGSLHDVDDVLSVCKSADKVLLSVYLM